MKILLKSKKVNPPVTSQQRKHFYKKHKVPTNPLKAATAALVEWHYMSSTPVHHSCAYTGLALTNKIFSCEGNRPAHLPPTWNKCPHLLDALRNLPLSPHESAT